MALLYPYRVPIGIGAAEGAIELGALKASDGSFSYDVPAGVDVDAAGSVVIWCRAFSVVFATASLDAA